MSGATPSVDRLLAALDATWPAAATQDLGLWRIRQGLGGGQRVSCASTTGVPEAGEIALAEGAMAALDQAPVFRVMPGQAVLDAQLDARGYVVNDASLLMGAPVADLCALPVEGDCSTLEVWEPLAIQREIWAEGGIGAARVAVMERVAVPHTSLIGRWVNTPGGTAFAAADGEIAMIHALEVPKAVRRRGMGRVMTLGAAHWASKAGATWFCLAVRAENDAATGLYRRLGMEVLGRYHYRVKPSAG